MGVTDELTDEHTHTHMILFGLPTQYALRATTDLLHVYLPVVAVNLGFV